MDPARGLDPEVYGVRGGPSRGIGHGQEPANETQGGDTVSLTQVLGATSPSVMVRDDPEGNLSHGITITLPDPTIFCVVCSQYVGTVLRADNHFRSTHGGMEVRYECGSCHKTSLNYHSIVCHVPKCQGSGDPSIGGATPTVQCEVCGRGFGSSRALSTHERHVHPAVRNRQITVFHR